MSALGMFDMLSSLTGYVSWFRGHICIGIQGTYARAQLPFRIMYGSFLKIHIVFRSTWRTYDCTYSREYAKTTTSRIAKGIFAKVKLVDWCRICVIWRKYIKASWVRINRLVKLVDKHRSERRRSKHTRQWWSVDSGKMMASRGFVIDCTMSI